MRCEVQGVKCEVLPAEVVGRVGKWRQRDGGVGREVATELLRVLLQAGQQAGPLGLEATDVSKGHYNTVSATRGHIYWW